MNRSFVTGLIVLATVLIVSATVTPGFAQERFGSFVGAVQDPSGALLPDVNVTITNKESNREITTKTDSSGSYVFKNVEPGRYSFKFERQGFATATVDDALLLVGRDIKVDAKMQLGQTTQAVTVSETAPLIDTTGVLTANNVTAEEFDRLPKGRTFQGLVNMAPNVNSGTLESGYDINGASGAENSFMVDGVRTNSLVDGRSRENAPFEFLQEVQVKTGGMDAEYGGALGGVVSAITKSGGNQFHGEAHYYYYGNAISAGPRKRLYLFDQYGSGNNAYFVQDHKNQNDTHEVGGSIGGPFIKNKLFFFAAVSPSFNRISNNYLFNNGTEPDTLNSSQNSQQVFTKVTATPWQRVRANFSWLWTPARTTGILPAYNANGNAVLTTDASVQPLKTQGWTNPQSNYNGQIDFTISPTAILSVKGARFWDNFHTWGIPTANSITFQTAPTGITGLPSQFAGAAPGFVSPPRTQQTFFDITTQTNYQVDFSKFIGHAFGSHDLKIGGGTVKNVNKVDVSYPGGGYIYMYWNTQFKQPGTGALVGGQYGYYEINNIGTRGTTSGTISNLYIQDHWRIVPRLTLTLGLRVENEHIPSFRPEIRQNAFSFEFQDKLSPRLGFAWDVKGNGKLKVFASYNRLYGYVGYEVSRGSFGGDFWTVYYRSLDTLNITSINGNNLPGTNLWPTGAFRDRRVPNFNSVAPGIKPMSTDLFNGGAEYQLTPSMVLRADYVGNHLRRTIEDMGVLVNGDEVYQYVNPGEGIASTYLTSSATPNNFKTPKVQRDYDAFELTLTRRLAKNFSGQVSYVFSRLYGNYNGTANGDEITTPTSGVSSATTQQSGGSIARPGSNASRAYDLDETLFDAHGNFLYGPLAFERPHMLKLYGNYIKPWSGWKGQSEVGVFFRVQSGEPVSTAVQTVNTIQVYVNGRGDLGRTPVFNQTDLMLAHEFKLAESKRLRFEFNATNLFNQKSTLHTFNQVNRGANTQNDITAGIDLTNTNLFQGFDYKTMLNALVAKGISAYDPRFGMADYFNVGFAGRVGVKFLF
jgi:hypothetical protein